MSVKIIYGNEPYYIDKVILQLKEKIQYPEMNLSTFEDFSDAVISACDTFPVVDNKRLVILTLEQNKGEEGLLSLIKSVPDFTDLVIVTKYVDKRTNLYKYAKNENLLKECGKLTEGQLRVFIHTVLSEQSAKITDSAYSMLSKRMNYFDDPDINLYTVEIYVKQLCFLSKIITEEEITKVVPPTSNEKAYALTNSILAGQYDKSFSLALEFIERGENPIGLLSMMQRIFRLGFKASMYEEVDKSNLGKLLGVPVFQFQDALHIPFDQLNLILNIIQDSINGIKTGRCEAENLFLLTIGKILSMLYPAKLKSARG